MNEMSKNRKLVLYVSIVFSVIGVINLVLYAIFTNCGVAKGRDMGYLFAIGFIATVWIPMAMNLLFKSKFKLTLLLSYEVFMYLSIAVGSMWSGYTLIWGYDKIIHFISGVLFALLGYNLFKNGKINTASLVWIFIISFSISMMSGGVWEIYEFTTDILIGNNAQGTLGKIGRDAIMDTMLDLCCDCGGAVIGAFWSVLLEKFERKNKVEKVAQSIVVNE